MNVILVSFHKPFAVLYSSYSAARRNAMLLICIIVL